MPCETEIDRRGFLRSVAMTGAAVAMHRQGAAAESAAPVPSDDRAAIQREIDAVPEKRLPRICAARSGQRTAFANIRRLRGWTLRSRA